MPRDDELEPGAVAVVIPTRDRADLLALTLRSVREQTLPVRQLIVADDGSTDHTEAVVGAAGGTLVRNPAGGWGAAGGRNAGLAQVRTEFVAFVDSDDLLLPEGLQRLRGALSREPAAPFAYGRALVARVGPDAGWEPDSLIATPPWHRAEPLAWLYAANTVPSPGTLVRTASVRAVGGYDEDVVFVEDHDLWVRLARLGAPAYVPEVVAVYRRHAGNRQTPVLGLADRARLDRLADDDERLREAKPLRDGVELCEVAIQAIKDRSPRALALALRPLGPGSRRRDLVLRAAARHFAYRRAQRRAGVALWARDADLRRWLAGY